MASVRGSSPCGASGRVCWSPSSAAVIRSAILPRGRRGWPGRTAAAVAVAGVALLLAGPGAGAPAASPPRTSLVASAPATAPAAQAADAPVLTPAQAARVRTAGTWTDLFDPDDLANRVPLLAWAAA